MKRKGYRYAVAWIALNDNPGDNESLDILSGYVSVALVADLFGVSQYKVAQDVWIYRSAKAK